MGLTKRQAASVNRLISEDVHAVLNGRNERDRLLHQALRNEQELNETPVDDKRKSINDRMGGKWGEKRSDYGVNKNAHNAGQAGNHPNALKSPAHRRDNDKNGYALPESDELEAFDEGDDMDLDEAEYGPKGIEPVEMEGRVNIEVAEKHMEDAVYDGELRGVEDDIFKLKETVHRGVVKELAQAAKKYGIGYIHPNDVGSILDIENEDVSDAEMEFVQDLQTIIAAYAKHLTRALLKQVDRTNADYEG